MATKPGLRKGDWLCRSCENRMKDKPTERNERGWLVCPKCKRATVQRLRKTD